MTNLADLAAYRAALEAERAASGEVASREVSLRWCYEVLSRLDGADGKALEQLDEVAVGQCEECGSEGLRRRHGRFALCRRCALLRIKVGRQLEEAA